MWRRSGLASTLQPDFPKTPAAAAAAEVRRLGGGSGSPPPDPLTITAMKLSQRKGQRSSRIVVRRLRWVALLALGLTFFLFSFFSPAPPREVAGKSHIGENNERGPPRIYIYELPPRFNDDWLENPRCARHLFAAEVAIHVALLQCAERTLDPNAAEFFFVPVYVSCNFSTVNGFPSLGHARGLLASAVELVSSRFPFWDRHGGADHVFIASHDYGACFHAMDDVAATEGIPSFMKRSIILQTFGVERAHPCQIAEHVLIPPYVPPALLPPPPSPELERKIWVYFRGKMEVHPKNISGRIYGNGVRTEIWRRYGRDRRFFLKRKRHDGFRSEMATSVFCLCPRGWAPWSPRIVEAVAVGCVPVIIADGIRLPFPDVIDWPAISLRVAERDVARLGAVLRHVAATNLSLIQRRLWDPANRDALLFNRGIKTGDATWQILRALSAKKIQHNRSRT
ncbi:putative glucuronosyltransferase Os03g0107900 [Wolffia australiana]